MITIASQRDLIVTLKKETVLNISILNKLYSIPLGISRQVLKEDGLNKLTQNTFNELSYYLICIINPKKATTLSWPISDNKMEKVYRNELASFVADYSSKGLLASVTSSYLVNLSCYKVTRLIFQLSQLAIQTVLKSKMYKEHQKKLYSDVTEKYKLANKNEFTEKTNKELVCILSKYSNYLQKREIKEKIAAMFRNKITQMEEKLRICNAQNYIDSFVDGFISRHELDKQTKTELLKIKNVFETSKIFDAWLEETDNKIDNMEADWKNKIVPFLHTCEETMNNTEALVFRYTGNADKKSYMIEFNPKLDKICTDELQKQVNSEQRYVLKSIIRDDKLNFPNLIRGFVISICFILKNTEVDDEIYKFNDNLEEGHRIFNEMVSTMRAFNEKLIKTEARLKPSILISNQSVSEELIEIPPLPDLSNLKFSKDVQSQVLFDMLTPLSVCKRQFNLRSKCSVTSTVKHQNKSFVITPFRQGPREDFLKSIASCRLSIHNNLNASQNYHNVSNISHVNRGNITISNCGFMKQHITRLLSTKKSSTKKFKRKNEKQEIHVKKSKLFKESSNESSGLFRSYSSPDLYENRGKSSLPRGRGRKLSIMAECSFSHLEVSGIAMLERDNSPVTSSVVIDNKNSIGSSLPVISIKPKAEQKINDILKEMEADLNKEICPNIEAEKEECQRTEVPEIIVSADTPNNNVHPVKMTGSLEKIINRFRKVRASVIPSGNDGVNECRTIAEEKENLTTVNILTVNKVLLPDLLSPSCSAFPIKSMDCSNELSYKTDEEVIGKPRESLGAALGVDQTFLDQFELID